MKTFRHIWVATAVAVSAVSFLNANEPQAALPESGVNVARASGGWININVENNRLKVTFFDEKKKPAKVDVARATARLAHASRGDRRVVLNPSGDDALLSTVVQPPHIFRVYLTLIAEKDDGPNETYSVQYP